MTTRRVSGNGYGFVYGIRSLDLIKVGVSYDTDMRLDDMRALNPHGCDLVFRRRVKAPYALEKRMHKLLADKYVGREWFRASLDDVRAASRTARLEIIHSEREFQRRLRAEIKKPRKRPGPKVAHCVNLADHALNEINRIAAGYSPLIRTHDKERNEENPNKSKGIGHEPGWIGLVQA